MAWHLGQQLQRTRAQVIHVHSRTASSARAVAERLDCAYGTDVGAIATDADLYLLAVSDGQIAAVTQQLAAHLPSGALVVHTSGATPSSVLSEYFARCGVFYPLQTFSKDRAVDFRQVPLCLLAQQPEDYRWLRALAAQMSDSVTAVSDAQRLRLHLAAVFVNNFTNHLQHISQSLVETEALPGELLLPLLRETIAKLDELPPAAAQTGPARRNDEATLERHLALLQATPDWQAVYQVLSDSIRLTSEV